MEQDDMPSDIRREPNAAPERETSKDLPSVRPPTPSGPRIVNDGPESPRSNLC
jgi:hypothetical protein